jgi:hypothetical protein
VGTTQRHTVADISSVCIKTPLTEQEQRRAPERQREQALEQQREQALEQQPVPVPRPAPRTAPG